MEPLLIVATHDGNDLRAISEFDMDMSFGDDTKNDFEITFAGPLLSGGERLYLEGTEYGGVIDEIVTSTETDLVKYRGRTWQGVLASKILAPNKGDDYLFVSGDANQVISQLISKTSLQSLFKPLKESSGINISSYQFERYTDAYTGIKKMLATSAARLRLQSIQGGVSIWAEKLPSTIRGIDSDAVSFEATATHCAVNHLIGLGKGELAERIVSEWFADSAGHVSQTQSLFGIDEIAQIYDYSSLEAEQLAEETKKKLKELQKAENITFDAHDPASLMIGDILTAQDNRIGLSATAAVVRKTVKVSGGVLTVNAEMERK